MSPVPDAPAPAIPVQPVAANAADAELEAAQLELQRLAEKSERAIPVLVVGGVLGSVVTLMSVIGFWFPAHAKSVMLVSSVLTNCVLMFRAWWEYRWNRREDGDNVVMAILLMAMGSVWFVYQIATQCYYEADTEVAKAI